MAANISGGSKFMAANISGGSKLMAASIWQQDHRALVSRYRQQAWQEAFQATASSNRFMAARAKLLDHNLITWHGPKQEGSQMVWLVGSRALF